MADNEEIVVTSAASIIAVVAERRLRRRRQRSFWVRSWMLRRRQLGTYGALVKDLRPNDEMAYWNFCRMDASLIRTRNCWRWSLQSVIFTCSNCRMNYWPRTLNITLRCFSGT